MECPFKNSFTWCWQTSIPHWLLARGFSSTPHGPFHKLPKCSHSMTSGLSQSWWTREKQRGKEKPLFFYNTISEVKCHLLCDISYSDFHGYRDGRDYTRVGKFHGWRSLVGYSPWDHKESTMPEQLHWFTGWIPGGGDTFGVHTGDRLPQEYRSALWQWGPKAIKIKAFFYWRIYLFSPQIKII